jgi:hypothetical protein
MILPVAVCALSLLALAPAAVPRARGIPNLTEREPKDVVAPTRAVESFRAKTMVSVALAVCILRSAGTGALLVVFNAGLRAKVAEGHLIHWATELPLFTLRRF